MTFSPNCGLGKRQPIDVSKDFPGLAQAFEGFSTTQGARVIDSTPPATTTSASPAAIIARPWMIEVSPEAHSRLTVKPGIESGRPARRTAMRATLRLSSPAWFAAPMITSSMSAGSIPVRSTTAFSVVARRSSGRWSASAPP